MLSVDRDPATTGGVGSPEHTDADRRIADLIRYGKVVEVNYANPPTARVLIGDEDDDSGHLITGWLPISAKRASGDEGEWDPVEVGERVAVHSESGELQNGYVCPAAFFTDESPAPGDRAGLWRRRFKNGAVMEYDRESGAMLFDATDAGSITLKVGESTLTITAGEIVVKAAKVTTDGPTHLNNGSRGVVFQGSKDTRQDTNNEAADGVFV